MLRGDVQQTTQIQRGNKSNKAADITVCSYLYLYTQSIRNALSSYTYIDGPPTIANGKFISYDVTTLASSN
jgi:hypothetical protein